MLDVPTQDVISRDNVSVKVNAVLYFRVVDPERGDHPGRESHRSHRASSRRRRCAPCSASTSSTRCCRERDKLNLDIQRILDQQTDAWGIKVANVEIKHVDLNESMIRAIARQAEAERERRAKIIHAEGEQQAAAEARRSGRACSRREPQAMQLRYLQTLADIAGEKTSTIVFPLPMDLLRPFISDKS